MAASTVYSVQQTNANALANGTGYSLNNGITELGGKVRCAFANWVSTAVEAGSDVVLFKLPKNARVLSGVLITGALGSSVTGAIGTDISLKDDTGTETTAAGTANCLAATSVASASNTAFCATRLLGAGAVTSAETTFKLRLAGATCDASIPVHAWVLYLQN
jgi:hypothetical protein